MAENQLPKSKDLLWPTLEALKSCGGSASIRELSEWIAGNLNLSDELLDAPHKNGRWSEVDYRAGWARTDLKSVGAVDNTSRGVWTITDIGRKIQTEKELRDLFKQQKRAWPQKKRQLRSAVATHGSQAEDSDEVDTQDWKETLLNIVREMPPDAFERLCQRILRESGFIKVEVTGRSGDEGIDGAGVLRVNLISFHVRFQCKRYSGSVGASEIRDFRGAMVGRADKGLFITTGRFTRRAEREAVRDGAPAIDLINGDELCDLLKNLKLGVTTETVEVVNPKAEFFETL